MPPLHDPTSVGGSGPLLPHLSGEAPTSAGLFTVCGKIGIPAHLVREGVYLPQVFPQVNAERRRTGSGTRGMGKKRKLQFLFEPTQQCSGAEGCKRR